MRITRHCLALAFSSVFGVSSIRADVVAFDVPNEFTTAFQLTGIGNPSPPIYTQAATGGISGGTLNTNAWTSTAVSAIYKTPKTPNGGLATQVFFKLKDELSGVGGHLRLGFVGSVTTPLEYDFGDSHFFLEIASEDGIDFTNINGTLPDPYTDIFDSPFILGRWYRMSLAVSGIGSNFEADVEIQDYGTNGLSAGTFLYNKTVTFQNASAALDTSWYAGFAATSKSLQTIDNFSVSAVPEMNSAALVAALGMAIGGASTVWRGRRGVSGRT